MFDANLPLAAVLSTGLVRTFAPLRPVHLALVYLTPAVLSAQQYAITTFAGGAPPVTPAPATSTSIGLPAGIAVDDAGNIYFSGRNCIFRSDPKGVLTRIAGNSRAGYAGDRGPAINAQITSPNSVAVNPSGNIYITDNNRVRMISASGVITTVAGNGGAGFSGDGGRRSQRKSAPRTPSPPMTAATSISRITSTVSAGSRPMGPSPPSPALASPGIPGTEGRPPALSSMRRKASPGQATKAQFRDPWAVALDRSGNIYIADAVLNRIRKISLNGIISTVAGGDTSGFSGDGGPATAAQLNGLTALAVDSTGNLYIADSVNHRIRRVSPDGIITTVAGNGTAGSAGEGGPATSAQLWDVGSPAGPTLVIGPR